MLQRISGQKASAKRRLNPAFRVSAAISSNIRQSLRTGKSGRSWERLVGYSRDDLVKHLERQFVAGMDWQGYGQWHVDHIVPLASFTFETAQDDGFRAAWALSNLRPLWSTANLRKGPRRTHLL